MAALPGTRQEKLNKLAPAAAKARLGDALAELIAQVNILTAAHNALVAKLNADAGVTDTNYATVAATTIADLESRT